MRAFLFVGSILLVVACIQAVPTPQEFPVPVVPFFRRSYGNEYDPKIVNGKEATPGQFPYQAGLTINGNSFCGGALISDTWVLTAGHCTSGFTKWQVTLGAHKIKDTTEQGRQVMDTTIGFPHENFDGRSLANDVSLVKLPSPVTLNARINIIKLAPKSYQSIDLVGKTVRTSGWGKVKDSAVGVSPTLQFVDLNIISNKDCATFYGSVVRESTYCCSGAEKKTTCHGDSGGALTLVDGTNVTHIGTTSFVSSRGCESGNPSGFAATPYFVDWIKEKTGISSEE